MAKRRVGSIDEYWMLRGYRLGERVPGGYRVGTGPAPRAKPRKPTVMEVLRGTVSRYKRGG